jgi:DNA polymerase epsilon subunit 1
MHLERREKDGFDDEFSIDEDDQATVVVPSVVTAWSIMNYMGTEVAHEYFRIIIGRFSREVLKKQIDIKRRGDEKSLSVFSKELNEQLLDYKRKMISKHFASYLTRAVGEIIKDDGSTENPLPVLTTRGPVIPVLQFIKSVMVVLELDKEVEAEVNVLRRSLLNQVDVAEYSSLAKWENPCPTFVLPDLFCAECQESRDVNLCYIPPQGEDDEDRGKQVRFNYCHLLANCCNSF